MSDVLLEKTLAAFDQANRQDPNTTEVEGQTIATELLYAQRMSACLQDFAPEASAELQLAARAQHLERWIIARSDYPLGRAGYKRWRVAQGQHHAQRAVEIMQSMGYSPASCEQVSNMVQKKHLKRDPQTQTLEDVACLVFIRHYLEAFSHKHSEDKLIGIIRKTWNKMSVHGQQAALNISLSPALQTVLEKSLQP